MPNLVTEQIAGTIGDRMQLARAKLHITQRELARRLGVSPSYMSSVERGEDKANAYMLVGFLLNFPRVNPDWLLTGRGEMDAIAPIYQCFDQYTLDIEAIQTAQDLFLGNVLAFKDKPDDKTKLDRLISDAAFHMNLMYRTYMSYFHSLVALGKPEQEARAAARRQCEQLDQSS